MAAFALGLTCMSGAFLMINTIVDVGLWPLTKTLCPPGAKMTIENGCDDRADVDSAGETGRWLALLCCVLSAGLLWWKVDVLAAFLFCLLCCLLSIGVGVWASRTRSPRPSPSG